MAAWQEAKGYEATGVLTTRQRAELLGDYNDTLSSLGLASVTDRDAGIEIVMPTAMVEFDRYEAPFAHYTGDQGVRVVLISQSGGQSTLYGLYDILQSLEVIPPTGERNRGNNDFTINGEDRDIVSYTYATVVDGAVKGYMLVWPKSGDERLLTMAMDAMKSSFASTGPTALDDNAGLDEAMQSVDLVSGLEIRRADRAMTGFYVDGTGTVLTTAAAVDQCSQIMLDESYPASVTARDDALGVAHTRAGACPGRQRGLPHHRRAAQVRRGRGGLFLRRTPVVGHADVWPTGGREGDGGRGQPLPPGLNLPGRRRGRSDRDQWRRGDRNVEEPVGQHPHLPAGSVVCGEVERPDRVPGRERRRACCNGYGRRPRPPCARHEGGGHGGAGLLLGINFVR